MRIRFRTYRAKTRARCAIDLFSKGVLVFRSAQPDLVQVAADMAYEALVQDSREPAVRDDLHRQRRHHADSRRGRGARPGRQQGARLHGLRREQG